MRRFTELPGLATIRQPIRIAIAALAHPLNLFLNPKVIISVIFYKCTLIAKIEIILLISRSLKATF